MSTESALILFSSGVVEIQVVCEQVTGGAHEFVRIVLKLDHHVSNRMPELSPIGPVWFEIRCDARLRVKARLRSAFDVRLNSVMDALARPPARLRDQG